MIDDVQHDLDPEVAAAVFGAAPLESIALRFESRAALLQFYANSMTYAFPPQVIESTCESCRRELPSEGFIVLSWRGTAKIYWGKVILVSTVLLPALILFFLLPVAIIYIPAMRIGEEVSFQTLHPICRGCWGRYRIRQVLAGTTMFVCTLIMALSFLVGAITGSLAAAALAGWWGLRPDDTSGSGLIFLGCVFCWGVAKFGLTKGQRLILIPSRLRSLGKKPFWLYDAKLVGQAKIVGE